MRRTFSEESLHIDDDQSGGSDEEIVIESLTPRPHKALKDKDKQKDSCIVKSDVLSND